MLLQAVTKWCKGTLIGLEGLVLNSKRVTKSRLNMASKVVSNVAFMVIVIVMRKSWGGCWQTCFCDKCSLNCDNCVIMNTAQKSAEGAVMLLCIN